VADPGRWMGPARRNVVCNPLADRKTWRLRVSYACPVPARRVRRGVPAGVPSTSSL